MMNLESQTAARPSLPVQPTADIMPGSRSTDMAPAAPEQDDDAAFADRLLLALANMAARSKRGQADLTAVLRGAGIAAEPRRVRAALRLLQTQGCVQNFVPLSDGGLLLSVTPRAAERFAETSQWLPREETEPAL